MTARKTVRERAGSSSIIVDSVPNGRLPILLVAEPGHQERRDGRATESEACGPAVASRLLSSPRTAGMLTPGWAGGGPGLHAGVIIRAWRRRIGITQEGLAQALSVTFSTVSRWENGHVKPSRLAWRALERLAARLGSSLLDGSDPV